MSRAMALVTVVVAVVAFGASFAIARAGRADPAPAAGKAAVLAQPEPVEVAADVPALAGLEAGSLPPLRRPKPTPTPTPRATATPGGQAQPRPTAVPTAAPTFVPAPRPTAEPEPQTCSPC